MANPRKNAAGQLVTSTAEQVEAAHQRALKSKKGPNGTVKLRAIEKGYYGYPVPDLIEPGSVFGFRIGDLQPRGTHAHWEDGRPVEHVTIDGSEYEIPAWCEDARKPVAVPDDDEDDDEAFDPSDDVI